MVKTKEEWAEIYKKARAEFDKIDQKDKREHAETFIGKCYKYRNSYGAGENSKWWLYLIIIGVKHTWTEAFEFETDCGGEIRITQRQHVSIENHGYIEIPRGVFLREWRKLLKKIGGMEKSYFQK